MTLEVKMVKNEQEGDVETDVGIRRLIVVARLAIEVSGRHDQSSAWPHEKT